MADDNNIETVETTTTPAEIAPPKKRRGPKPKNVVAGATAEAPKEDGVKTGRGRRKNSATSAEGVTTVVAGGKTSAKNSAKGAGKTRAPKQTTAAAAPVLDDIADLLQLEEENARLRKALAEKLRAENADLRKRLGLS